MGCFFKKPLSGVGHSTKLVGDHKLWDYDAADRLLGLQVFLGLTVLLVLFFYHYIKKQP